MRWVMYKLKALPPGQVPDRNTLDVACYAWGNPVWSSDPHYLEEVCKYAASTRGPILECGSGLTTLLLGALAGRRGVQTWSLEHTPAWRDRVRSELDRYHLKGVNLCLVPLKDFGEFSWYDAPVLSDQLPNDFRLVVCDGPPHDTPGGRYGLFRVLKGRFAREVIVLLDDAGRDGEKQILAQWQEEEGMRYTLDSSGKGLAIISTDQVSG